VPTSTAVRADLYERDPEVRRTVLDAPHEGSAEIMFWGDPLRAEFEGA